MFFRKKKVDVKALLADGALRHIAFIMDGNGRWARLRGLAREQGHKVGAKVFQDLVEYCSELGLACMTVYAFSTENWKRPKNEVDAIFALLSEYLERVIPKLASYNVRIRFLGDPTPFPAELRAKMQQVERMSEASTQILNIAINYGGRDEILHAVQETLAAGETVSENTIERHLYTVGCPPLDLVVRTGGELRISNFLVWQSAYAELYFTKKLWPDMRPADVDDAILAFYGRRRRFGAVDTAPKA